LIMIDILLKICGIFGPIAITALSVVMVLQRRKRAKAEPSLDAVEDWLAPVLFDLVTQAEQTYGGGVGRRKLASVVTKVIALLPDDLKRIINSVWICARAEKALASAKVLWAENPALLCN